MENLYLQRYAHPSVQLDFDPPDDLKLIVTIPAFKEKQLLKSLESLKNCNPTDQSVLVIVLINQSENCKSEDELINEEAYQKAVKWVKENNLPKLKFKVVWIKNMPAKHAGVGLARKIAMDEAVRVFEKLLVIRPNIHQEGIIVCFDADCTCDNNYLQEIEREFTNNKSCPAAVIYYEHPLVGELQETLYSSIVQYELFLRYHVDALRYAGFPYAYQTVGSCMAVRSSIYQKQGGMNKKQAGEDFYFLQKMFPLQGFKEIYGTRVIPLPRFSDRVPFGTGKAMLEMVSSGKTIYEAYHPQIYQDLKMFIQSWKSMYNNPQSVGSLLNSFPESIKMFLTKEDYKKAFKEIVESSPSEETFKKKFFHWLNGFKILKFIHFARDEFYPSIPIKEAAHWLLQEHFNKNISLVTAKELLIELRFLDRNTGRSST